ncbi:MAG: hypothetical protein RL385_632 [Pseudomonadota bacterium]|jgi:hypothetical protein
MRLAFLVTCLSLVLGCAPKGRPEKSEPATAGDLAAPGSQNFSALLDPANAPSSVEKTDVELESLSSVAANSCPAGWPACPPGSNFCCNGPAGYRCVLLSAGYACIR